MSTLRRISAWAVLSIFMAIAAPTAASPNLEVGVATGIDSSWTTVNLGHTYTSMVAVAVANYDDTDDPMVVRIQNASGSSFDVRVDAAGGAAPPPVDVHYMVIEEGVYTQGTDGVTMEAVKYLSTVTDRKSNWDGEAQTYANSYTNPVVLGQVMTYNDAAFSFFWCSNGSRTAPPSSSALVVGKGIAEDPVTTRADETVGYIVIESGSGTIDGVDYVAALGSDIVRGPDNSPPYTYSLSGLTNPQVAIATQAAMDGNDGGWAVLYGASPLTSTTLDLMVDEDVAGGSERSHTSEQVGYIVFDVAAANMPPTADAGPDQNVTDTDDNGSEDVTLDGSGSSDSDGTIISYEWEEASVPVTSGVSPLVTLSVAVHTIDLTVTDDDTATDSDSVVVTVNAGALSLPILIDFGDDPDATGGDQTDWIIIAPANVNGGLPVFLSGGVTLTKVGSTGFTDRDILFGSSLPDNYTYNGIAIPQQSVSHDFMKDSADPVKISGLPAGDYDVTIFESYSGIVNAYIWVGDQADKPGTSNTGDIAQVFVTISVTITDPGTEDLWVQICGDPNVSFGANGLIIEAVTANAAPTADAGPDQNVNDADDSGDESITLDGSGSSDSDGTIVSYEWEEASVPVGSGVSPVVSMSVAVHTIDLIVTDDDTDTDTDSVQITVTAYVNIPPTADAGPDQNVNDVDDSGAENITLDGSGSSDSDGTIVSYEWEEASVPVGSGVSPVVSMSVAVHTIDLIVTDDDTDTDTDSVQITVTAYVNIPPTADAGPDQSVTDTDGGGDEDVSLDGSGSSDSDGTIVSYDWEEASVPIATGVSPVVTLSVAAHTIDLTVTDDDSATDSDSVIITVDPAALSFPILIDFGDDPDATGGDQTDWTIIAPVDVNGGAPVSLGGGVTLTKVGSTDFTHRDILFGSSLPDNYTYNGITIPVDSVAHDFMKESGDPVKISGLPAGDYDVTIFASYNGGTNAYIWVGDQADKPGTSNTGDIAQVFVTISVTITDPGTEDLWVQICGDPNVSFGANGLIIEPLVTNVPPTADAGPDQNVTDTDDSGDEDVTLDGSGSSDSDGTITSYSWEETSSQIATGVSPVVTLSVAVHTIDLIVTDDASDTDTDSVTVTVNATPPTIMIDLGDDPGATGGDQTGWVILAPADINGGGDVSLGGAVTLTKVGTTDFDDRYISFGTSLPDNFTYNGIPIPEESVSHDFYRYSSDPLKIAGLAVGSYDVTIFEGYNGTVESYIWAGVEADKPGTSNTGNIGQVFVTINIDIRNPATEDLWVQPCSDGGNPSFGASGIIIEYVGEPSNLAPTADAGPDQTLADADDTGSENVTLDGTGSTDPEDEIVSYVWEEDSSQIATGVNPIVSLSVAVHTIDLTVTDVDTASDTDSVVITVAPPMQGQPLPIVAGRNGISLSCSGVNGEDWVVEWRFNDPDYDDHAILYVNSDVQITLAHNDLNVVSPHPSYVAYDRVIGTGGVDDDDETTDDEGEIHFDFDGDGVERTAYFGTDADYTDYAGAFTIGTVDYPDTSTNVWGTRSTTGGTDGYGAKGLLSDIDEEWHTLNIWDDDSDFVPNSPNGKVRASDGYVWVVVMDVQAPVIQLVANPGSEFYTTPAKTYHIPELKDVISYVSGDVYIQLYDLSAAAESIYYRVDGGTWTEYTAELPIANVFTTSDTVYTFDCRVGTTGTIRSREVHYEPAQPASGETHPQSLLWADATEEAALAARLADGSTYEALFTGWTVDDTVGTIPGPRGYWRSEVDVAKDAMDAAFVSYFHADGMYTCNDEKYAQRSKELLLGLGVIDPLGHEKPLWMTTPCPDRVVLGFEQSDHFNAAIAYTLLANYQAGTYDNGMTPIEHIKIRDNLANMAFTALQFRDRNTNGLGEGDTHWGVGLDELISVISMAMPTYDSPAYGASGADGATTQAASWRPFLNTKMTWFDATDPANNGSLATGTWPQDNEYSTLRMFTIFQEVAIVRDIDSNLTYNQTVWMGPHSGQRFSDSSYCVYDYNDSDTYHIEGDLTYEAFFYKSQPIVANMRKNFYSYTASISHPYHSRQINTIGRMTLTLCNDRWSFEAAANTLATDWEAAELPSTFNFTMREVYNLSFCTAFED